MKRPGPVASRNDACYRWFMESIFDYNPTEDELKALFGFTAKERPDLYAEELEWAAQKGSEIITFVRLFALRGDSAAVQKHLAMIEDPRKRFEAEYLLLETS